MDDPILTKYLSTKREPTRRRVERYLTLYLKCHNISPTELLEEAWHEQRGDTPPWMHRLPQRIERYKDYLESRGYSELTVKASVTNIRSFYLAHGIHIPKQKLKYRHTDTVERVVRTVDDLPGRGDILLALKNSNIKYQSIILVMATSGMDASTCLSLDISDFTRGLGGTAQFMDEETSVNHQLDIGETRDNINKNGGGVVSWHVTRRKLHREDQTPTYYDTYSTPEASLRILEYLEQYPPTNWGDTPLFRATSRGRRLPPRALHDYFRKLNTRCGWGRTGRLIFFRSHNLRKWFSNQLASSGMPQRNIDYLLDHRPGGRVHNAYFKPNPDELRAAYVEHMAYLSLGEEIRVRTITTDDLAKVELLERRVRELEELKRAWELYDQLP